MNIVVSALFLLSGLTGLIYQVLWAKYLSLFLGNTAHAHAVVLSVFLGGLSVGYILFGRSIDRRRAPLEFYGILEIGVGLLAAASPWLLDQVAVLYVRLARDYFEHRAVLTPLRIVACSVAIFLPATLMGGTLPALTRFCTRTLGQLEQNLSWLYFLNSAGATVGPLLGALFFIPILGLDASIYSMAVLNIAIGIVAIALGRKLRGQSQDGISAHAFTQAKSSRLEQLLSGIDGRIIFGVAFASGIASLIYEVAWIRLLSLVLGSSTYSFALMLSAFIGGIALGSYLVNRGIFPSLSSIALLAVAEIAIAVSILVTIPLYESIPVFFLNLRSLVAPTPEGYYVYLALQLLACVLLMALPVTFIGMTLPLAGRAVTNSTAEIGKRVGGIYGINCLGNVVGALFASLIGLPWLGLQALIEVGTALNLLCGFSLLYRTTGIRPRARLEAASWTLAIVVLYVLAIGRWDKAMLVSGSFMQPRPDRFMSRADFKFQYASDPVVFYKDDNNVTVSVQDFELNQRILKVNGKIDASSHSDLPTQLLSAHIPLLLHPKPEDVLVIGMGSGITAGAALRHPVKQLDLVEISSGVVEAARLFKDLNYAVHDDPRTHLFLDDAKSFLQISPHPYDVIISEPSNPWIAGIGGLFSTEFYQLVKQRLKPGGLMVQWFHVYSMNDEIVKLILRTFTSEFPHISVWSTLWGDYLMVGSVDDIKPDLESILSRMHEAPVAADLSRVHCTDPWCVLSLQLGDERLLARLRGSGPLNHDRLPILEHLAPAALFQGRTSTLLRSADRRLLPASDDDRRFVTQFASRIPTPSSTTFSDMYSFYSEFQPAELSGRLLAWWESVDSENPDYIRKRVEFDLSHGVAAQALEALNKLLRMHPQDMSLLKLAAKAAALRFQDDQWGQASAEPTDALRYLDAAVLHGLSTFEANLERAKLYKQIGRRAEAMAFTEKLGTDQTEQDLVTQLQSKKIELSSIWEGISLAAEFELQDQELDLLRAIVLSQDREDGDRVAVLKAREQAEALIANRKE